MLTWQYVGIVLGLLSTLIPSTQAGGQFENLFHFIDAQATSTNPGTNPSEFSPKRALQPGTGSYAPQI